MEFLLVVGAIVLLVLLFATRGRLKDLEQRVEQLHEKVDWIYKHGSSQSTATAAPRMVEPATPVEPVESLEQPIDYGPAFVPEPLPEQAAELMPEWDDPVPMATPGYAAESLNTATARKSVELDTSLGTADATEISQQVDEPYERFEPQTPEWMLKAKEWLFGGNLVAKIGLLILFIGVSFLLKYAAARVSVPIELRLAGIVLADIGLLFWGWRIRDSRPAIGLSVQGGALGILMLVTFGAFRIYHLIPGGLAFGLLFFLTFFTCLLAVLQDAIWLAIFGIIGGFAAPILTSTGHGSHIGLFSYYALLNAGILAIALKRSWRLLNLLGFAFTFLIGTAWGARSYLPENYLSSQGFLILFFAFYVAIAILYASRQAPQLKHYVDGTLVFGTPLLAFGLQYALVQDKPFGLAYSALALGLFYIGLTLALWQRRGSSLRLLVESFLALGIVFGTLAIPFALDGRWTAAAWALEGAGIVWVGLRQKQTLAWVFGVLVQVGAWVSYIGSVSGLSVELAAQSNLWLGFLLLAGTGFAMAMNFRRQTLDDSDGEEGARPPVFAALSTVFLGFAAVWLLAGAWSEIFLQDSHFVQLHFHTLLVLSAMLVAAILGLVARRLDWSISRYFALVPQLLAGLAMLWLLGVGVDFGFFASSHSVSSNLFETGFLGGVLIALGAGFSSFAFHRESDDGTSSISRMLLVWCGFWWFVYVLGSFNSWGEQQLASYDLFVEGFHPRVHPLYGFLLALAAPLLTRLAKRLQWSDLRWLAYAVWPGLLYVSSCIFQQLDHYGVPIPGWPVWVALLALWLASEWMLREGVNEAWLLPEQHGGILRVLHVLRTVGPWLILLPLVRQLVTLALQIDSAEQVLLLSDSGWFTAGSWTRYLPAWAMMAYVAALVPRARAGLWPTTPISGWYRERLIPLGALCFVGLAVIWNFTENGLMEPLPYLPVLNPLDLTTGFAALLAMAAWRLRAETGDGALVARLPYVAAATAYVWFNLMLLRTAAHYLDLTYQFEPLFRSQFVQAMLSLVWSATALILMRHAAKRVWRTPWMAGAGLLALVVAKLFFVDLSNIGGIERIISFLGVGVLMLAIGYLAPFPSEKPKVTE